MNDIEVVLRDGGEYKISKEQLSYWCMLYPDLNVVDEITYLKELWTTGAAPRKTAKNINKFINKWLYKQSKEDL
ncbi:MAG: hypothetical protein J6D28_04450 [Bacilli bacterium]|nr:hypothetical protein [Bacilli bacterium]